MKKVEQGLEVVQDVPPVSCVYWIELKYHFRNKQQTQPSVKVFLKTNPVL